MLISKSVNYTITICASDASFYGSLLSIHRQNYRKCFRTKALASFSGEEQCFQRLPQIGNLTILPFFSAKIGTFGL